MSFISLPPLSCVPFFPHDRVAVIAYGVIYRLGSLLPRAEAIPALFGRLRDDDTFSKKHFRLRSRILIILLCNQSAQVARLDTKLHTHLLRCFKDPSASRMISVRTASEP
jgi:hypothetical protein